MNTHAIEIRGLTKSFRKFKLGPLDLTVPKGAIYGFIGPNAAGKTTTIDLMLGMGRKEAGSISMLGLDHEREGKAVKQRVGYVSPDLSYATWGRVGNAIQFVRGFYPTWDADYCARLMRDLRVGPHEKIASLSFGSRIKLALILALSHRPELLILDEPTVGLDAVSKSEVFGELLTAVQDGNRTVFISSHNLTDLERFADHIGMIKDGKLLVEGATDQIVSRFCMVDFLAPSQAAFPEQPGATVLAREPARCRVLVDKEVWRSERFSTGAYAEVGRAPVTLEELFVALARN